MVKPSLKDHTYESAKATRHTLAETFETMMRLLHPFMPFISEEIWQTLPHEGTSIVRKPYPSARTDWNDKAAEQEFSLLEQCRELMNQERAILNFPAGKRLHFKAHGKTTEIGSSLKKHKELIEHMENVDGLQVAETFDVSNSGGLLILTGSTVQVRTSMEDADLQKANDNVNKQIKLLQKEVDRTEQKLGNPDFVAKAPPDVLDEYRERLERESQMIQRFEEALGHIKVFILDRKRNERS
jgi:valyl-tRNA synthetase